MIQDARFALRSILKRPAFTAIIVLTLALGIGANSAVFSVIDALMLRPFPIPDIERMVMVFETFPKNGEDRLGASPANFLDWQKQTEDVFERLVAYRWWDVNLTGNGLPERVQGTRVTPGFLDALGAAPGLGRTLIPEEFEVQRLSVVLSHRLWVRRFGSDPAITDKSVRLNGEEYQVVGVAPAGFEYPWGADVWAPLVLSAEETANRGSRYLEVLGRLREGVTADMSRARLDVVGQRLAEAYPETNEGRGVRPLALATAVIDIGAPAFLVVWQATVVFVLLIACVNVANLLLAKGSDRQSELSIRLALGASRWRIVRQILTENVLLALGGAVLALPMAWLGIELLRSGLPPEIRRFVIGWDQIDIDFALIGFTLVVALLTSLLFGLLPALWASRADLNSALKEGGRGLFDSPARQMGRSFLVAGELAVALMLLVAAGLSIQGSVAMLTGDQGYDPEGLMSMEIALPAKRYATPEDQVRFYEDLLSGLSGVPEVVSADAVNILPSSGTNRTTRYQVEDNPIAKASDRPAAHFRSMSPDYLDTMKIPLRSGRRFSSSDRPDTLPVAIVSQKLAEQAWPGSDPSGKRLKHGSRDDAPWLSVVGVAGDVTHDWFLGQPSPTIYVPLAQSPRRGMYLAIRTRGEPAKITAQVRSHVMKIDSEQPIYNARTMRQVLSDRMIGLKYAAVVMGVFGAIALVLSVVGIYGLMSYSVSRRLREIGIRVALGASKGDVFKHIIKGSFRVTAVGLAFGLVLAWTAGSFMESTLFGTVSMDLGTVLLFAALLGAASMLASYFPARKALSVHPADALRVE